MLVILATRGPFLLIPVVLNGIVTIHGPLLGLISLAALISFSGSHLVGYGDLLRDPLPHCIDTLSVAQSFKDSIATNHYKVKVVLYLEALDIWVAHNNVGVATVSWALSLNVSEGLRNRETARENSQWSLDVEILLARVSCSLSEGLRSVDLSTGCLDSDLLELIVRLVVTREHTDLGASVDRHHSSGVSHIDDINHIVNDHNDIGT